MEAVVQSVYYLLLIAQKKEHHIKVRNALHHMLPNAIVESLSEDEEIVRFLSHDQISPHLIIIDEDIVNANRIPVRNLIACNDKLSASPLIFLKTGANSPDLPGFSVSDGVKSPEMISNEIRKCWQLSLQQRGQRG